MSQYSFIMILLFTFLIVGVICVVSFSNTKLKPEKKQERPENLANKTIASKHLKIRNNSMNKVKRSGITRAKRSPYKLFETQLQTNLKKEHDTNVNVSYTETSQVSNENYKKPSSNKDSLKPKYLSWQLNLNVTNYGNHKKEPQSNNPSDNANNLEKKSDQDYMDMAVYMSGRGTQLYNAWGSVGEFIKSLFGRNSDKKIISGNEVLGISRKHLNTPPINTEFNGDKVLTENPSKLNKSATEFQNLKGKEGKFLLGLFGFGGQTTPANSPERDTENLDQSVASEEHSLEQNTIPKNFPESQAFSDADASTVHSRFEITHDVENGISTFHPQSLVSENPVEGRENSLTNKSAISDEITGFTEDVLKLQTEQSKVIEENCFDCEPKLVAASAEFDLQMTEVPHVSTVALPPPLLNFEESTFTNEELEKYCMALVNRLGKSLRSFSDFSDGLGSGDMETVIDSNDSNAAFPNLNTNQIDESIKSENVGFFASLFSAITGRQLRRSTGNSEKLSIDSKGIATEPGVSSQSQPGSFDDFVLSDAVKFNLDTTQRDSTEDEFDVHGRNKDPNNLPSIFDCEHFYRNMESTKRFSRPNLIDIMNNPIVRLEDFENSTITSNLEEQEMLFLTDLLKTEMNQTPLPGISAEANSPHISKGDSTATILSEKNTKLVQEQVTDASRTEIKIEQALSVKDWHFSEKNYSEFETSKSFTTASSVSIMNDEQTTVSPDRRGKFLSRFFTFGSGERSIDPATAASVRERFFGLFAFGSGDGRMDVSDDQVDSSEFETVNILSEFESDSPRDFGTKGETQTHMVVEITSFGSVDELLEGNEAVKPVQNVSLFEGNELFKDLPLTTDTIFINKQCEDCPNEYEMPNVTDIPDCKNNCTKGYDAVNVSNFRCEGPCPIKFFSVSANDNSDYDCEDCASKDVSLNANTISIVDCDDCEEEYEAANITNVSCQENCDDESENINTNVVKVHCESDCAIDFENQNEMTFANGCEDDCQYESENDTANAGCGDCELDSIQISNITLVENLTVVSCDNDCEVEILKKAEIPSGTKSDLKNTSDFDKASLEGLKIVNCSDNCERKMPLEQRSISKPANFDYEDANLKSSVSGSPPGLIFKNILSNEKRVENSIDLNENIPTRISHLNTTEFVRVTTINFPAENEKSTTEENPLLARTIFLTESEVGGLPNGERSQANLMEQEERLSNLPIPKRGARLDDVQIEKQNFLASDKTRVSTSDDELKASVSFGSRRGARFDDVQYGNEADLLEGERRAVTLEQSKSGTIKDSYDLTTVVSTGTDVPPRITRRRGRLDDELENPMENSILETKNNHIPNVSSPSDIEFNESVTQSETESLPSSTPVPSIQDSLPKPTEPQQRLCASARECNQALNERCLVSRCDCGRAFVRHRETGVCEAKVVLETSLKLPQEQFHEDLINPYTMLYKEMKQKAEDSFWLLLSEDPDVVANIANLEVSGFSKGSIVINYKVVFAKEENKSVADLMHQLNYELNEAFHNESLLKLIPLDGHNATLLDNSNVTNPCFNSELNYCSDHAFCEKDNASAGGFYCRCLEGYRDVSNNKKYAGEICEETCLPNYCGEHGVCQINQIMEMHCSCSDWYFGEKCQLPGQIIIAAFSSVNALLVISVVILLLCYKKQRQRSRSYVDKRRRYNTNLEFGSNLEVTSSKIADVIALEENIGIKTSKISAISSTPIEKPQAPMLKVIRSSFDYSSVSGFDSTFDNTPSPIYENIQVELEISTI